MQAITIKYEPATSGRDARSKDVHHRIWKFLQSAGLVRFF